MFMPDSTARGNIWWAVLRPREESQRMNPWSNLLEVQSQAQFLVEDCYFPLLSRRVLNDIKSPKLNRFLPCSALKYSMSLRPSILASGQYGSHQDRSSLSFLRVASADSQEILPTSTAASTLFSNASSTVYGGMVAFRGQTRPLPDLPICKEPSPIQGRRQL